MTYLLIYGLAANLYALYILHGAVMVRVREYYGVIE